MNSLALVMAVSASAFAAAPECGQSPRLDLPSFSLAVQASGRPTKVPATAYLRIVKMPYRNDLAEESSINTIERLIPLQARYDGNVLRTEPISVMLESYHIDDGVFFKTACYENLRAVVFGFNERPDPRVTVRHKRVDVPLKVTGAQARRLKEYLPMRLSFGTEKEPSFADSFKHWETIALEELLDRPSRTVELEAATSRTGRLERRGDMLKYFLHGPDGATYLIPEYLPDEDRACFELAASHGWTARLMGRASSWTMTFEAPGSGAAIRPDAGTLAVFEISDETLARCAQERGALSRSLEEGLRRAAGLASAPDWH